MIVKDVYPISALLNLQLSDSFLAHFQNIIDFAQMFGTSLKKYGIQLLGGDTTSSKIDSFGLTILGKSSEFIPRKSKNLKKGDMLVLLGKLGGSSFALDQLKTCKQDLSQIKLHVKKYYTRPNAQWAGRFLLKELNVKASIDVSDSLYESLNILSAENLAQFNIFIDQICYPPELENIKFSDRLKYLLGGGEDFTMLMIIPSESKKQVDVSSKYHSTLKVIGEVLSVGMSSNIQYFNKNEILNISNYKIPKFNHF